MDFDVAKAVDAVLDAVEVPLKQLRDRIAALEQRVEPKYCGTWKDGETYAAGSLATHAGSMWYANEQTSNRPGTPKSGWTLAVKRGSIGKAGR